jgi:hypothetical protein
MEDRMMKRFIMMLFISLLGSVAAFAQYGKISGKVTDQESKEPLVGANVVVEGTVFGTATDLDGAYVILNVPAGTYNVKVSYIGYQAKTISGVSVLSGLTRELNVTLSNAAVQVGTVTVLAERPLIEKSATNAVRVQMASDIEKLPVRGVQGYFSLQPGVVLQNGIIYMRGSRNDEVGYMIEGADVRDVVGSQFRNNVNSSLVTTIPEAIEEVSVQAGGYAAELGGANAGMVSQTFKTGGSKLDLSVQAETDNFGNYPGKKFLGTYSYGYSDYVITVGTPLLQDKVKLFLAGENNFIRDRDGSQWFWSGGNFGYLYDNGLDGGTKGDSALVNWNDGNVPGRVNNRYTLNGTLLFDFSPLQIRLAGAFSSSRNSNNNTIRQMFDLARVFVGDNSNMLLSAKASYFFSQNTILEGNLSYVDSRNKTYDPTYGDNLALYQDSVAAASHGWTYQTITAPPAFYNFNGFQFYRPGQWIPTLYSKDKNNYVSGSLALTSQMSNHEVKAGVSAEFWSVSHYDIDPSTVFPSILSNPDAARDPAAYALSLRQNSQVNNYGYDEYGNPISSGLDGPKNPFFVAAYAQDKVELTDIIINAGLRLDVMNLYSWTYSDLNQLGFSRSSFTLNHPTRSLNTSYLEPRLGFSFPASERTVFHLQYAKLVQAPPLYTMYRSRAQAVYQLEGGHFFPNPIGYNVNPERTTQYEIGFSQQFSDVSAFDITGFYKDITGQLQAVFYPQPATSPVSSFYAYTNGDFQSVLGVEFSLRIRRIQRLQAQLNYTMQDARGTNSFANGTISLLNAYGGLVTPTMVVPLDYAQANRGSISLDYRWAKGDGGPILEQLGLNFLFTFNSGHPFTLATGSGGQQGPDLGAILNDGDARTRFPVEPINNSTTPWVYQVDFRLDKTFSIGSANLNVYIYVQNLFNTKNVINVYYRTGNAYDDGWLSDPVASGKTVANPNYGTTYEQLYQVINLQDNQNQFRTNGFVNFGAPRQLRVGAKLEL